MTFSNPITGGQGTLVRPAIKSPDYSPGVSGWTINRDGSAEFNDLTIRGTFYGVDYVISAEGIFFYSGTPAAGNMAGSWAPADGTDPYGNAYVAGLTLYSSVGQVFLGGLDGIISSTGSSGAVIAIEDGQINFTAHPDDWGTAIVLQNYVFDHGSLTLDGGADTVAAVPATFSVVTAPDTPTTGHQDTYPRTETLCIEGPLAHHYVTGAVIKTTDSDGQTGCKWQAPTYNTGWTGGSTASANYQTLEFRLTAEDEVWLYGAAHATAATPSNTVFTLPAGYQPKPTGVSGSATIFGAGSLVSTSSTDTVKASGRLNIMSDGRVVIGGFTVASGDNFYFDHKIPLGNIQ